MAGSAGQLTVEELEERFRAAKDVVARSHCQGDLASGQGAFHGRGRGDRGADAALGE